MRNQCLLKFDEQKKVVECLSYGVGYVFTLSPKTEYFKDEKGQFPSLPKEEELAGQYDILYFIGTSSRQLDGEHMNLHQTTIGTLTMKIGAIQHNDISSVDSEQASNARGKSYFLHGHVEFNAEKLGITKPYIPNYNFLQYTKHREFNCKPREVPRGKRKFNGTPGKFVLERCSKSHGYIMLVGKRAALGLRRKKDHIHVETMQEAHFLVERYSDTSKSWLSTHLNLPTEISFCIRQYVCPPPVLFLEKNDLWIDFFGAKRQASGTMVARRRVR